MGNKLTFGDLKEGQKFISFPVDGDNSGHGGYKGDHWICLKLRDVSVKEKGRDNAIRCMDGCCISCPDDMNIISVAI